MATGPPIGAATTRLRGADPAAGVARADLTDDDLAVLKSRSQSRPRLRHQRADVAWRAVIQMTPQNNGSEEWTPIGQTRSTRRSATDGSWADFLPKTYDVGDAGIAIGLRVVYRLTWYRGATDEETGSADHLVAWYLLDHAAAPSTWEDDYCYTAQP